MFDTNWTDPRAARRDCRKDKDQERTDKGTLSYQITVQHATAGHQDK